MSQQKTSLAAKQAQLAELLTWFEGDDFSLDQASEKLAAAHQVAAEIEDELNRLENEIQVLDKRFDQEDA